MFSESQEYVQRFFIFFAWILDNRLKTFYDYFFSQPDFPSDVSDISSHMSLKLDVVQEVGSQDSGQYFCQPAIGTVGEHNINLSASYRHS